MKAFLLLLSIVLSLSASTILFPSSALGQRKKPVSVAVRTLNEITPRFVHESLLGETLNTWKFEPGEPLTVRILSKKFAAGRATAMVWIDTTDVNGARPFGGKVLLTFERSGSGGFLLLASKENVNFGPRGIAASPVVPVRPTAPERRRESTIIASGTFHLPAATWRYWDFYLPTAARVTGRFQGEGGAVQGVILTQDEYVNWKNNNDYRSYYRSGSVTIGNVDILLPAGSYKFALYNGNWLSGKTISVSLIAN